MESSPLQRRPGYNNLVTADGRLPSRLTAVFPSRSQNTQRAKRRDTSSPPTSEVTEVSVEPSDAAAPTSGWDSARAH